MQQKLFKSSMFFNENKKIHSHIIPFESVKLHNHNFIEFFYVLSGSCNHNLNGKISTISIGNAFLLLPNDYHQFKQHKDSTNFLHRDILITLEYFREFCDMYSPTLYDELLYDRFPKAIQLSTEQIKKIEQLISFVLVNHDPLATKTLLFYIINNVLFAHFKSTNTKPAWITHLISQLNAPESLAIPLSDFIKNLPYSHEYICREFKKTLGMTMTDYFNKQKMEYALVLLQTTNHSIEQIAYSVGINNIAYFYQLFKKYYGTTPSKKRKE